MDRPQVAAWVTAYERAWRAPGTAALARLFTPDARYLTGPYQRPIDGLPAIARMWEAERAGPDEAFRLASEVVAADGDTGVVRVEVWYGDPVDREFRDLWVIRFGPDGRCRVFEEWPFSPPRRRPAAGPSPAGADRREA
jgi:ketosteroid isomerase-like protein